MKSILKKSSLAVVILLLISSCATIYRAPDLASRTSKHKIIAFIPFEVVIQYKKLPKNTTVEQMKQMEEDMGNVFQEQMYTRFLKKITNYTVEIQDIAQTNALLKKQDVTYAKINEFTKAELATILGVDAIVSGKILTSQPISTGGAIAMGVLTGYSGATNKVDVNVSVHDGLDSKLLFKFDHTYSGGIGSSAESLSKAMMKSIARKFPYQRN